MVAEISAISADRGPAALERHPCSRRLRRTARPAEMMGIIAPRKVVEAVVIVALRHLAVVDPTAAVMVRLTAGAADLTAEDTADNRIRDAIYVNNDLPSAR